MKQHLVKPMRNRRTGIILLSLLLGSGAWLGLRQVGARAAAAPLATTIVVNSTADGTLAALAGNTTCDLREAMEAANTNAVVGQCAAGMAGADTISFAPNVSGTIGLTAGQLVLNEEVTITGPGANLLSVSGSNLSRVFFVNDGVPAAISGLTIERGDGGGTADGGGGGIFNAGNLTLTASQVTLNTARAFSSGIRNVSIGTLTIERSAVTNNTVANVDVNQTVGGGIDSSGTLTVTNSTVSGNQVLVAGAHSGGILISSGSTATITGSTITDNTAFGPGSAGGVRATNGTVTVRNTIIAANRANTTTPDVEVGFGGTFASEGYNLIGNPGTVMVFNQTGDQVGTMAAPRNPVLGPLAFNSGPTRTHRPLSGSPAIDQGNSFGLTVDQRGLPRPQDILAIANALGGDGADIGAVEIFGGSGAMNMLQLVVDPATNPAGAAQELITAINIANEDPTATTIKLVCGVYTLTTRGDPTNYYGFNGLPAITSSITIEGNGAVIERSSQMGTPTFRLFAVAPRDPTTGALLATPGSLTLEEVTLRGGLAQGGRGGASDGDSAGGGGAGLGGAVYNGGTLVIRRSALTGNTAQGGAGGSFLGNGGGEGGGGGGLGGNGGDSTIFTEGGSGGGGFGGNGGTGGPGAGAGVSGDGGGGGGTITDGRPGDNISPGAGGTANGGRGGTPGNAGTNGGFGGGGGGGGGIINLPGGSGGRGGEGGGGGGGGGGSASSNGGLGGFGGGGGGGGATGGSSRFAGGAGGSGGLAGGGGGAGLGGALFNDGGALTLTNSTLSGNAAQGGPGGAGNVAANTGGAGQGLGGGLFASNGTVTINHATLNNNTAAQGGGAIYLLGDATLIRPGVPTAVTFNITNSIFANSTGTSDAFINTINSGTLTPGTNNNNLVEANGSTAGADANDLPGVTQTDDPQLGALTTPNCAASGCRIPVHPLTTTSPAFNAAGGNIESVDKCGTARPQGPAADLGAFEAVVVACTTITATVSGDTAIRSGQSATVTVTVSGGTAPYTITLSNGGGTLTGPSPLTFTVSPSMTTTYTVTAGTDNNSCSVTPAGSATVTVDSTPPTITCPPNQTGVIAGTNGPVTYAPPTVSDDRQGATFTCTPASGDNFALGTRTVNCTATDAVGNTSAMCSFTVTVRQPRPAIKDLITRVRALVPPLTTAQANGLIGQLELANTNLERGQTAQACAHLQNFVHGVSGYVSGGQLTQAQGQALVSYANKIRNAVGCTGGPFPI